MSDHVGAMNTGPRPATPGGSFHAAHTPSPSDANTLTQDADKWAN
jgi:hypothetical protein